MNRITPQNKQQFEELAQDIMDTQHAVGMAVVITDSSGNIQYENYMGYRDEEHKLPINRDTIFGVASVTKSFTALAIMQLAEQGKIDLDDPVSKYVPSFTNKNQKKPVKIWHLLCHSGGFFPLPRIVVDAVAKDLGLDEEKDGDLAFNNRLAEEGIRRVAGRLDEQTELIGEPGELLSYCNDGYGVLSDIIKNYGGCASYAEYIDRHILQPLGMTRSGCDFVRPAKDDNASILYTTEHGVRRVTRDYHDDAFVLNGGGAMKSTPADLVKYVNMYLNRGVNPSGDRLAARRSIAEMCKPRQYFSPRSWYGYGLEIKASDELNLIGHSGGLPGVSSYVQWSYEAEAGVIVLCNTMDVSVNVVAEAAMRMYQGKAPKPPKHEYPEYTWSKERILAVCGDYVMGEGDRFTLSVNGEGKLAMTYNGVPKTIRPVTPELAITPGKYADGFVQILEDEERGIWGGRCGSRIFPKIS